MYCIRCIKRLFFGEYSTKNDDEIYRVYRPITKIKPVEKEPLTEKELYETSMFKKISEWSIED